jgi:hypothetical protein
MEQVEEFAGLFPPAQMNSLHEDEESSSGDMEEDQFPEHELSDLED